LKGIIYVNGKYLHRKHIKVDSEIKFLKKISKEANLKEHMQGFYFTDNGIFKLLMERKSY